ARRCAAMDRPYGPAPITATGNSLSCITSTLVRQFAHGARSKAALGREAQEVYDVRYGATLLAAQPVINPREPLSFRPRVAQQLADQSRLGPRDVVVGLLHEGAVGIPGQGLWKERDGVPVDRQLRLHRGPRPRPELRAEQPGQISLIAQDEMPELRAARVELDEERSTGPLLDDVVEAMEAGQAERRSQPFRVPDHRLAADKPHDGARPRLALRAQHLDADHPEKAPLPGGKHAVRRPAGDESLDREVPVGSAPSFPEGERVLIDKPPLPGGPAPLRRAESLQGEAGLLLRVNDLHPAASPGAIDLHHGGSRIGAKPRADIRRRFERLAFRHANSGLARNLHEPAAAAHDRKGRRPAQGGLDETSELRTVGVQVVQLPDRTIVARDDDVRSSRGQSAFQGGHGVARPVEVQGPDAGDVAEDVPPRAQ